MILLCRYIIGINCIRKLFNSNYLMVYNNTISIAIRNGVVVNHKVVRIEELPYTIDTYDISTEKNHNFALTNGIFVHNSVDTTSGSQSYNDRLNNLGVSEDIILPVWGEVHQL